MCNTLFGKQLKLLGRERVKAVVTWHIGRFGPHNYVRHLRASGPISSSHCASRHISSVGYIRNLRVVHSAVLCSVVVQFMWIMHLSHQRTNSHTRARLHTCCDMHMYFD